MNRALFSGLSGTVAFQERLDVVGNNLANSNTVGYKQSRTTFEDALYETLESGTSGSESGVGGSNPIQIGSGVSLGTVSVQHTQGSLQRTGQALDCAIEGEGMFVVSDGEANYFTRDGSFALDSNNTLVSSSSGLRVMGWEATDGTVDPTGAPGTLTFDVNGLAPAVATQGAVVEGNLNSMSSDGDTISTNISIYDSLGESHQVELTFTKTANVSEWECEAACGMDTATVTMQFDDTGALTAGDTVTLDVTHTNGATSPQSVEIDLSETTGLAQSHSVAVESQDGCPAASLVSIAMNDDGMIDGEYSDGRTRTLGQIATASFTNPSGLQRTGENLYVEAPVSGAASIGAAGTGGRGSVVSGSLEMSNVDLTSSFVDMITTQRGFQASTRVISTANEMLDDVVRLIRS